MKTSPLDFVLSGLFITAILAGALALVGLLLAPLTRAWLGDYYAIADFLLLLLSYGLLSAVVVRLMLKFRPVEPGEYTMDAPVFTYWKLLTILYRLGQGALRPFTPVFAKPLVEMLFGAKIGADVALGGTIDDPYMVSVGAGAVLGNASLVSANVITKGRITFGKVTIGAGATLGANAVVLPGCDIGDDAVVMGGAMVMAGTRIPAGETWRGNPARKWL
jgi:serine acetyltransferase